jgi:hypothetical protein
MSCDAYRELVDAYLDDTLDEVRRTGFRAHLQSCADCRSYATGREPTLALILDSDRPAERERVEACVTAVMAGIRRDRLERRLRPSRRPWLAAAAVAMLAVAAATWWSLAPKEPGMTTDLQAEAVVAPQNEVSVDAASRPRVEPPRVEVDMTEEEVRVYRYAIGDDDTTGAIFIVNPAMEL